ncbi:MAG: polyphenol oxidase family protein [Verrucomicrobiae bacterium]|nr:polyphenol oxidase family protein [Verrucomicrobiae bacterium]
MRNPSWIALLRFPWLVHGFLDRTLEEFAEPIPEEKLTPRQIAALRTHGISRGALALAEQVHGAETVEMMRGGGPPAPGADGLMTQTAGIALGIHVADCCAVYLADPGCRAIGLLHSGRKGTMAEMPGKGVRAMVRAFGSEPGEMVAALSPCIHICCYGTDFVADIERQLKKEGVREIWRHPDCTACSPERYDSYRRDRGRTGRMLAFMMIRQEKDGAFGSHIRSDAAA